MALVERSDGITNDIINSSVLNLDQGWYTIGNART